MDQQTEQPRDHGGERPLRVGIADDHPVFRFGMRALMEATPDLVVGGEAASGEEAVALAETGALDVLLMDLNMPGLGGLAATARIRARHPALAILVVSMLEDDSVFAAMRAGARGYIVKGASPANTLQAIRAVGRGEAIFSPDIAERVLRYFAQAPGQRGARGAADPVLTAREQEVLGLIAHGLTNSAIAARLGLSPKTVRNYISEIFSKLQVANRAEAIAWAREAGVE
jgi:DNA-binding NarL/FixJ family response regulator